MTNSFKGAFEPTRIDPGYVHEKVMELIFKYIPSAKWPEAHDAAGKIVEFIQKEVEKLEDD
jgi:hypothetical protein